jgi:tetratricopeptide (TPR) repeat protein
MAIEITPNDADVYYNRAILKQDLGDTEGAMKDYDKAIEVNPDYANAYYNRAICYRKLAETEKDAKKKAELIAKAEADEQKAESLKKEGKK